MDSFSAGFFKQVFGEHYHGSIDTIVVPYEVKATSDTVTAKAYERYGWIYLQRQLKRIRWSR